MGFPGMITSVPCVTDKMKLKTIDRIISIMGEKSKCSLGALSSILTVLKSIGFCQARDHLHRAWLMASIHSYTDPKLVHTASSNFPTYQLFSKVKNY